MSVEDRLDRVLRQLEDMQAQNTRMLAEMEALRKENIFLRAQLAARDGHAKGTKGTTAKERLDRGGVERVDEGPEAAAEDEMVRRPSVRPREVLEAEGGSRPATPPPAADNGDEIMQPSPVKLAEPDPKRAHASPPPSTTNV